MQALFALAGWLGAAIVLVGYCLMVSGRLAAHGARYLTLNLTGSACLAVTTVSAHAWQSALVNVLWLAFGVAPLRRALRPRIRSYAASKSSVRLPAA